MMKLGVDCLLVASLFFSYYCHAYSQKKSWRAYSPADKSFTVELPAILRKVSSFEGEHGAEFGKDYGMTWARCYAAIETVPEDARFGIIVIDKNQKGAEKPNFDSKKTWRYLAAFLIGDDDMDEFMHPPVTIVQDGLEGQEYFYLKDDRRNNETQYNRGRIFVTKDKIYITVFVGKNEKDLKSSDANRFFDSFRVNQK